MNPLHLQTLSAIIDEESFEDAASILGVSPSAVSQRIKALEKEIGRVVVRRTSPPTPTDAGEILLQTARRMELLQAEANAQLHERIDRVPLTVAINADSLSEWFKPVLADVARWDSATLHVRVEDEAYSLALLKRGDVLGAVTGEAKAASGCESIALGAFHYVSVANPWLLDRYTSRDGTVDWRTMPVLRFGPRDALQDKDLERRLGQVPRRRRVSEIPSAEAFFEAARVGLGWALLPESQAAPLLESGEVVMLDSTVFEVPLYWQRWRLESPSLDRLTESVIVAASQVLRPVSGTA
ncbi:LysR family transcriptional regulator ArgP [Corynebacterium pseudotuberculosis]|uniref:ArgP/LysG family DNA-binding transcriptional regulator n=1 Tax=Corynebacterium pseudotuberculosis 258 TaxID=1168865 RepID=A0AAU8PJC1_CORPS|nr:LysR family transcriptional regulator ArgP [Corynebacterium pseudotuberculosis]AEQ06441.1 ArgP/LysG family DNA-binding transcriptional regulator [Corynebacterium pseudotuberculosis CIP 52.97]AFH90711.1 ArgP/LysG family DNA-binding transcriptional regulator [Corynebacterium pseudotuberculosis 31]AFK16526.2 ArgP/LysG family DNA-binding transcriptional regulator [Corynebacterium pseudotuberculosis 258]AKS13229.1 LysR family transcriptional regulator [Corynebacterium pseudotuberculosis]APB10804